MSVAEGMSGANHLARVLQNRIQKNLNAKSELLLDFGTILADYSLLTDTFPLPIPQSDYLVCRQLTLGNTGEYLTETHVSVDGKHRHSGCGVGGGHGDGAHDHDIRIPETMRKLKPGDRALVAWVKNDAVVIDLILPATAIS